MGRRTVKLTGRREFTKPTPGSFEMYLVKTGLPRLSGILKGKVNSCFYLKDLFECLCEPATSCLGGLGGHINSLGRLLLNIASRLTDLIDTLFCRFH